MPHKCLFKGFDQLLELLDGQAVSIVARECTVNVGNAAQIVSGNAAHLPSSAIMHNARLAP
jgi:hypothetical protein